MGCQELQHGQAAAPQLSKLACSFMLPQLGKARRFLPPRDINHHSLKDQASPAFTSPNLPNPNTTPGWHQHLSALAHTEKQINCSSQTGSER